MKTINAVKALRTLGLSGALMGLAACAANPALDDATRAAKTPSAGTPVAGSTASSAVKPSATMNRVQAAGNSKEVTTALVVQPTIDRETPNSANYTNLWDRIRAGFALPKMEGPYVVRNEQWFVNNPDYMERMLQRANLYLYHIVEEVEKRHIPLEIALLPAIESAYQPRAYSHARASGLWQFIPSTGRLYGLKSNWWYDGRRDVTASTEAALDYLQKLSQDFNGDWYLALAAYNVGEGRVAREIEHNRRLGLPTDYQNLQLPRETEQYVPKLMAIVNIVSHPERYGLELSDIPNSPYFVQVDVGSQIDLGVVAKLTNLPIDDVYNMNPAYNRWATSPDGPHHLLVPVSAKDSFLEGLNDLPPEDRLQWARHEVKRGESLMGIAHRYGVSTDAIRTANSMHNNRLRVGQNLLIPVSGRKLITTARNGRVKGPVIRVAANGVGGKIKIVHRVRPGENLTSIARKYNVYVQQLAKWNLIGASDVLRMGQRLMIWTSPKGPSISDD
jgi:membrane-bound lytic murein transglycosylase D